MSKTTDVISTGQDQRDAWSDVQSWIANASNAVEVCTPVAEYAQHVLTTLQVTPKSALGAVALHTGGILVDDGWVKILGSGCSSIEGDLLIWNGLGEQQISVGLKGTFVVGYDVVGGFFAINGGGITKAGLNHVFYHAPNTLEWEDCQKGYTDFLNWLFQGDLELFYEDVRWPTWRDMLHGLHPTQGFSFDPPLWEGLDIQDRLVRIANMQDIWQMQSSPGKP